MVRLMRTVLGMNSGTGYRLYLHHFGTELLRRLRSHRKSGHKKPGLNIGSTGITSVPGLFSKLFNVAASRPAQMTTEWIEVSPGWAFRQGTPTLNRVSNSH